MIKSVKANLLLNINDTHNVLCTTYFVIVWFKNQNFYSFLMNSCSFSVPEWLVKIVQNTLQYTA